MAAMDAVFKALADPSRRQLLDSLNAHNGQALRELCACLDMARQSVSKHVAVLEAARLVTTVRNGRERLHYLNAEPIHAVADRWIRRYDRRRATALADGTYPWANPSMDDTAFVYTTFIKTTPERLWQGLTHPEFTRRYWGHQFATDWRPGSPMTWVLDNGARMSDPEQVVLEADPYRRLAYTWHLPTVEWAQLARVDESTRAALAAEPRSRVSFSLEPDGETVKLTLVHDGFGPNSTFRSMISSGWPHLLSDLKTLLETGETLPHMPAAACADRS